MRVPHSVERASDATVMAKPVRHQTQPLLLDMDTGFSCHASGLLVRSKGGRDGVPDLDAELAFLSLLVPEWHLSFHD